MRRLAVALLTLGALTGCGGLAFHLGVSVAPLFPGWKTSEPPLSLFA